MLGCSYCGQPYLAQATASRSYWGVDSVTHADQLIDVDGQVKTFFELVKADAERVGGRAPEFWGRYIGSVTEEFRLTRSEARYLRSVNCRILLIYNGHTEKPVADYPAGQNAATTAIAEARKLCVPEDNRVWIYCDIEFNQSPTEEFFRGWFETMGTSRYGGGVYAIPSIEGNPFDDSYCAAYEDTIPPELFYSSNYSTVATAPSPDTTGTSLVVETGDGTKFPTPPFNATVWPVGDQPLTTNAEIVRVTSISGDTFTIIRTQEGTTARAVLVGDQIAATITVKTLTDVETLIWRARGLRIENDWTAPNSKVKVVADEITIEDVLASAVSVTADIAVSGANGLDTGAEAANTWYAIWLMYNPSTGVVASLLSTSFSSPTMPGGYTKKRRVGAIRNDPSSNFYRVFQIGEKVLFQDTVVGAVPEHRLLSAGTATAFTTVNASFVAPPTSRRIAVRAYIAGTGGTARIRITGSGVATGRQIVSSAQVDVVQEYAEIDLNSSQQFDYVVNVSSVQLTIISHGFYDQVL